MLTLLSTLLPLGTETARRFDVGLVVPHPQELLFLQALVVAQMRKELLFNLYARGITRSLTISSSY